MNAGLLEQSQEQFQAIPVSWEDARAAYPLVHFHDARVTLGQWLGFARRHCRAASDRAGLIAIRDCRGIIHALFSYRVDFDLQARKRLCVANLIVAHLPGSPIEPTVAATAQEVSAQLGCQSITIEQPFRPGTVVLGRCPTAQALQRHSHFPAAHGISSKK